MYVGIMVGMNRRDYNWIGGFRAADESGVPFAIMFLSVEGAGFLPQVLDSMQGRYFRNLPIQLFENVALQWISRVQRL